MNAIYTDYYKHGNTPRTVKDHCLGSCSSSVQNDTFSTVSLSNEKMTAKQTPLESEAQYFGDSSLCPALPIVNKDTMAHNSAHNSQEPEHESDVPDFLSNLSDAPHDKTDTLSMLENMNGELPANGLERLTKDEDENMSDKDEVIRMLREEVTKKFYHLFLNMINKLFVYLI